MSLAAVPLLTASAPAVLLPQQSTDTVPGDVADGGANPAAAASTATPLHTTEWKDVNVYKFISLTVIFSTMENALFYPFYVVKTREQVEAKSARAVGGAAAGSPWAASLGHVRTILAEQGVRNGLFRGFWASNITAFPAYGVYMGVYTWAKNALGFHMGGRDSDGKFQLSNLYAPLLAGVLADAASVALYVPGDIIVQRLQMRDSPYASFTDACRQIWRQDGFVGFFRGFGATFFTSGVASALWWVIYENTKSQLYAGEDAAAKRKAELAATTGAVLAAPVVPLTMWQELASVNRVPQVCAGFIAGTLTSCAINPLDVVKTRLQVQDAAVAPGVAGEQPPRVRYRNMPHGLLRLWKDEGVRGFCRGIMPKLVSRGPLSAMSGLLYEVVLHMSKERRSAEPSHKPAATSN